MKTRFQNLFYLEKALNRLNIKHNKQEEIKLESNSNYNGSNIIIPQVNGYNIEFCWNGKEYELVVDMSYWIQDCPIETFIDKISQQYASEVIMNQSKRLGFQAVKYQQNKDGSNTVILERWANQNF